MSAAPWDRQEGETDEAFQAWTAYRDGQPDATTRSIAAQLQKSTTLIQRWSRRWRWQDRLRAWSIEQDRVRQEQQLEHVQNRTKRHAQIAEVAQEALARPLAEILRRLSQPDGDQILRGMPIWDLYRLAVQAGRALPRVNAMERLALGLSSEQVDVRDARRAQGERAARQATDADLDRDLLGVGQTSVGDQAEAYLEARGEPSDPPG